MLNVLRPNDSPREVIYKGIKLLLVRHTNEVTDLRYYKGVIIDTVKEAEVATIIKTIRFKEGLGSLIPLFINGMHNFTKELLSETDGTVDITQPKNIAEITTAIDKRLAQIKADCELNFEAQAQFKTLAFLYSRQITLKPFKSRSSRIGYYFPLLHLFFKDNPKTLLKTLDILESKGLIIKIFKDNIHLCKSCDSTYLNFKEICPSCHSADITVRDMIHHFVCAHVAPEDDFKTDDGLSCPKCDKQLRHIGIDYDKPSSIYSCNSCAHEFQNPEIQATCFDCETDNSLSELLQKIIGNYEITTKGEQWLFTDSLTLEKESEKEASEDITLPFSIFKLLVKQELKRVNNNNINSVLGTITFSNTQLESLNIDLKKSLQNEISEVIDSYLKESDLLCATAYNQYYFLLPDTPLKNLTRLENITYNLTKLLNDNLDESLFSIDMDYHQIEKHLDIEHYFNH